VAPSRGKLLECNLEPLADHPLVCALLDLEVVEGRFQLPLRDREMLLRFLDASLKLRTDFRWNGDRPSTCGSDESLLAKEESPALVETGLTLFEPTGVLS
jgi:hypothetical protein